MTRVAVVCDYLEEGWPSMDLAAEMLIAHGQELADLAVIKPRMPRVPRVSRNAQRALGRYLAYPAHLARRRREFRAFHLVDHSYAHLALVLPAARVGIYCHDLDAFRAALPGSPAEAWRRRLAQVLLAGLRRARFVFHSTAAVRDELMERRLVAPERLVHAPLGVAGEFTPQASEYDQAWAARGDYLLHVGSLAPRKNPELLLEVFAHLAQARPTLSLVQVGGEWAAEQRAFLSARGLSVRVVQAQAISRPELAAIYRQARLLLLPSKAEGFGLPMIEALACATPVVASDLPVLREVGGNVAVYCPLGDRSRWVDTAGSVLASRDDGAEGRVAWASRFSWAAHASTILEAYRTCS